MYPNGPTGSWQMPAGDPGAWAHHETWWAGAFHPLPSLLLVVLIGVLIWGVLRLSEQRAPAVVGSGAPVGPPPSSRPRDAALEELRVRYARGEVDRAEYLERSADLGGPPTVDDATANRTLPGEPSAEQE